MTYGRSSSGPPDCNIGRIATPLPKRGITSSRVHAHTRIQSLSATCGCQELSQCVQALSFVVYQTLPLSHCVSLIKQVCMQRAMPQLSEMEMSFDFS